MTTQLFAALSLLVLAVLVCFALIWIGFVSQRLERELEKQRLLEQSSELRRKRALDKG